MPIKAEIELKEDIAFLKEILKEINSENLHDKAEGIRMLKDQIAHMEERRDEYANKSGG